MQGSFFDDDDEVVINPSGIRDDSDYDEDYDDYDEYDEYDDEEYEDEDYYEDDIEEEKYDEIASKKSSRPASKKAHRAPEKLKLGMPPLASIAHFVFSVCAVVAGVKLNYTAWIVIMILAIVIAMAILLKDLPIAPAIFVAAAILIVGMITVTLPIVSVAVACYFATLVTYKGI